MPSIISHAMAGVALGVATGPTPRPRRFLALCAGCAMLPDIDAIGRPFGHLGSEALFGGHRGFTHSFVFAVAMTGALAWALFREAEWREHRGRLWLALALATASHGVLDTFTTYGAGVALQAPFSDVRLVAPWQPLGRMAPQPSPWHRVAALVGNEIMWIWLPAITLAMSAVAVRWVRRARPSSSAA